MVKNLTKKGYEGIQDFISGYPIQLIFLAMKKLHEMHGKQLLKIDPEKAGFEPWVTSYEERNDCMDQSKQKEFIVEKLENARSEYKNVRFLFTWKDSA